VVDGAELADGRPVTSARLREAVAAGDVRAAAAMIGEPYVVDGRVVHGYHRGATIGVPTANLRVQTLQLPPDGVYAVTARTGEFAGVGVANLGTNPTFGNEARSLETNLFDFQGDLYGARLEVGFVERLRGEIEFDGVDSLVAQIRRDIDDARAIHQRDER
jgi:riboflavin kinase/FMN adenylyltransferase